MEEHPKNSDSEIIAKIFFNLWHNKYNIIIISFFLGFLAFSHTYLLPIKYQSYALLKLNDDNQNSLSSSFQGLSMLGISSASQTGLSEVVARMKSKDFISDLIEKNQMQVELHAIKEWRKDSRQILIDRNIYDSNKKQWSNELFPTGSPTSLQSYNKFMNEHLFVTVDTKNDFVTIGVIHKSPNIAHKWTNWLIKEINNDFKEESITETNRLLQLLEVEYSSSKVADIKKSIADIITNKLNNLAIYKSREYFKLKPIDPPFIPEHKISPNRTSTFVAASIIGFILSSIFYLIIGSYNKKTVFKPKPPFIYILNK